MRQKTVLQDGGPILSSRASVPGVRLRPANSHPVPHLPASSSELCGLFRPADKTIVAHEVTALSFAHGQGLNELRWQEAEEDLAWGETFAETLHRFKPTRSNHRTMPYAYGGRPE